MRKTQAELDRIDELLAAQQAADEAHGIWTPFQKTTTVVQRGTGEVRNIEKAGYEGCYTNNRYTVLRRVVTSSDGRELTWLSIRRNDRLPIRDWRELQRVKNEIVGPEIEAVELFPAESRLVDTSNQFHLWCAPPGIKFGFGYTQREVLDVGAVDPNNFIGYKQRPLK